MFFGRKDELKLLNEKYENGTFEFAIFYGRRRVGKTTLIKEFCKDKKSIYFMAREVGGNTNLQNFSKDVFYVTSNDNSGNTHFSNWEKAFEYIGNIAKNERLVLVIDEYPYLAQSYKSISSILQAHIDMHLKDSKLFLILCGSSMSFMENQVLGYKSPLYGRRTCQFKIRPFNFFDSSLFLSEFCKEDQAVLYGITGGIPEYLAKVDSKLSVQENIIRLFFTYSGFLFEEPTNLLKQELREPAVYNGIIESIAKGASRLNEISTKNSIESNKCAKYLSSLISLGIVKKELPVTEKISKKSIYLLQDNMFRFWYRFVFPNMSGILLGLGNNIYDKEIVPQINDFMGITFEEICKEYLIRQMAKDTLSFFIGNIGKWWGSNSVKRRQEEIDIMGVSNDTALFGECKWTNDLVSEKELDDLIQQSNMFNYKTKHLFLFSKKGFTKGCIQKADQATNINLIVFIDM
jgi:uncharacterized protein